MNKFTKFAAGFLLTAALALTACGDDPAKKSGLKSNELLENLPAIYADKQLSIDAIQKKRDEAEAKATQSGNAEKYTKAKENYNKAYDKIDAAFKEASEAEWAKVNGKEIPITMSDEFKKLKLEVVSAKVNGSEKKMDVVAKPTEDFSVNASTSDSYQYLNYKILAKDGSAIGSNSVMMLAGTIVISPIKYAKGEPVKTGGGNNLWGNLSVGSAPEKWVDFASVEFIGPKERK